MDVQRKCQEQMAIEIQFEYLQQIQQKRIPRIKKQKNQMQKQLNQFLNWVMRNKNISVARTGARTAGQLEKSLKSFQLLKLFDEKLEIIFENVTKQDQNHKIFQQNKKKRQM
ncbi:unnamed protein product [Paramecium sonneborni]|uniref:Uncharacterized protein n=1 Tax=Paramecium sonneborni TaxID=65129 RepID=A0A8S1RSP1_9CILI|nr:unnamed protein product [Paramecium sonneborni]